MISAELWAFESLIIFAGYLGVTTQAANIILMNNCIILFMIPSGSSEAICSLIGCCIGANNVALGKQIFKQTFAMVYVICMLTLASYLTFKSSIAGFFTQDRQI